MPRPIKHVSTSTTLDLVLPFPPCSNSTLFESACQQFRNVFLDHRKFSQNRDERFASCRCWPPLHVAAASVISHIAFHNGDFACALIIDQRPHVCLILDANLLCDSKNGDSRGSGRL